MQMTDHTIAESAEKLSRRQARILPQLAIIFLAQQATYLNTPAQSGRLVDHVKIAAWLLLSLVLLAVLATGGAWLRPKAVRELVNDESTRAHRQASLVYGFWAAMASALALYVLDMFEPVSGREAIHVILSIAIAAALIRFGMLERRALRDA
jgi:hypothetical protein